MKRAPVIALSALLAAALIVAFVFYRYYGERKRELALCEKENIALNLRLSLAAEETAAAEAKLIEKANVRVSELEKEIESTRQACSDLDEAFRKLRVEADEKGRILEILKQDLATKEVSLREAREKHESARISLEHKINEGQGELSRLRTNLAELEDMIQTSRRNGFRLEEDLRAVKAESEEKNRLIGALREELLAKETSFAKTRERQEEEILALRKELSVREKGLAETREKLEQELLALHKDVAGEKEELARLQKSLSGLEEALEAGRQTISRLEKDLGSVKAESVEKDKVIGNLKEELLAKETSFAKAREKQEEEILALRKELSVREKGLAETREKLEQELLALHKDVAGEKEELARLGKSLSELKGEKEGLEYRLALMKSTHSSMLAGLEQEIHNKEITIQELKEKFSITFVDQVLFESGKTTLTPRGKEILGKVSGILKASESRYIRVVGHTDNKPIMAEYRYKYPSNWELSAARAAMVVRFFQDDMGLDPANLEAVGRSFYEPVASNDTEEGRALNRRVNIVIAPRID